MARVRRDRKLRGEAGTVKMNNWLVILGVGTTTPRGREFASARARRYRERHRERLLEMERVRNPSRRAYFSVWKRESRRGLVKLANYVVKRHGCGK